ncbi:MAG: DUF433 domain-containing protein [Gammaproteobacteria bacterium]|nr:MAG: DUF433 domain-containing protein [Gammaproteobacteria bacterium]
MQLESYFEVLGPNDIRIAGTRIGIETVLYDYLYRSQTPEDIAARYPSLTLEQVYATILFYLHNQEKLTNYLAEWLAHGDQMRKTQEQNPPPVLLRLRDLAAKQPDPQTVQK